MGWSNQQTEDLTIPPEGGPVQIFIGSGSPFSIAAGALAAIIFQWQTDEAMMIDILRSADTHTGQLRLSNVDHTGLTAQYWNAYYNETTGYASFLMGDATTNEVGILSSDFTIDSVSQGRNKRVAAGINVNSAAIAAETVVLTTASATYTAGRAYEVRIGGRVQASAANTSVFKLRFGTTTAGGLVATFGGVSAQAAGATAAPNVSLDRYVIRDAADGDLTTQFCVTLTATAGTSTLLGATNEPSYVELTDVGDFADFTSQGIFL